jgi:hypothetical protein
LISNQSSILDPGPNPLKLKGGELIFFYSGWDLDILPQTYKRELSGDIGRNDYEP